MPLILLRAYAHTRMREVRRGRTTPADGYPGLLLPGPEAGPGSGFAGQVQGVPLIANDVGLAWLLTHVPWKPSLMLPPGAMVPL